MEKAVSGIMLTVLLIGMLTSAFNIQPVKASGTIYIRADGSIDPPTAPISTTDNIVYTFADNISDSIVVERDNIVVDGAGYTVQGGGTGAGIDLSYRNNVSVKNVKVAGFATGIYLYHSNGNFLSRNNISENVLAMILYSSAGNTLSNNSITETIDCCIILTHSSYNNIVSGNVVANSGGDAINLYKSTSNLVYGNVIFNCSFGIYLREEDQRNIISNNTIIGCGTYGLGVVYRSSNNTLSGNSIINNAEGVFLGGAWDNVIFGNSIVNNSYGIYFGENVYDNRFYHNNLIDNSLQAYIFEPQINIWDDGYPSGGNYWSDYTGVDSDGDGIGDTPYVIDANNTDPYPLMYPWSPLPVHNINTGLGYATIQEAINANETLNGHTIFVEAAIYYENIVVNKTVLLVGENRERTIIDGSRIGNVVHVVANNTFISDFSIQNGGPTYSGVRFDHSSHNRLINSNIINNYGSIDLFCSSNNTLSNNTVTSNYDGIRLSDAFNNTISDNNIASNFNYGIHLWDSFDNVVFRNNITNNYWYGIYLGRSSNNTFSSNTIASNGENGIHLESSSNYNIMLDNTIINNNGGIWLSPSCKNIISRNNITINKFGGIYLYYSSNNNRINGNNVVNNDFGVLVYYSLSNAINENNITANNRYGVALYSYSKNNTVNTNNIINNGEGIYLEGSSDNSIYHNNFINNSKQVFSYYSVNTWDEGYPSGGNYWSDYVGVDVKSGSGQDLPGSDGIGDAPHIIDVDNRDCYPLMNPYGAPAPPTYSLTIMTTAGGTTDPAPGTYSYTVNSSVRVTAVPESGYLFDYWELDDVNVGSANPCTVLMDDEHILKAVFSLIPPPLSASISPLSASTLVGQSLTFTSTVSGGYTPFSYQWYLNDNPVSDATSASWIFTPTASGIYYIHAKVTDSKGNMTQSETARVTVVAVPVGGYSFPVERSKKADPLIPCLALVAVSAIIFTAIKRKIARKTKSSPKSFS